MKIVKELRISDAQFLVLTELCTRTGLRDSEFNKFEKMTLKALLKKSMVSLDGDTWSATIAGHQACNLKARMSALSTAQSEGE